MRRTLVALAVLGLVGVFSGCNKEEKKAATPSGTQTAKPAADAAKPAADAAKPAPAEVKAPPAATPGPAATPQAAIQNWKKAIDAGDQAAFVAVFELTGAAKQAMEDIFPLVKESFEMEGAMQKAYGKDAALKGGPTGDWKFDGADDAACYTIEGDKATYASKAGGKKIPLAKIDGAWKIKLTDIPSAEQAKALKQMAPAMCKVMKACRENVGKPGYTADKINKELDDEMEKAMMAAMTPPDAKTDKDAKEDDKKDDKK